MFRDLSYIIVLENMVPFGVKPSTVVLQRHIRILEVEKNELNSIPE